jgi:hypothetical protein
VSLDQFGVGASVSLSDLASVGSFVSGVAVLASLVFLYLQMRHLGRQMAQSDKNQRAAINEAYAARASEGLRWGAEAANASLTARVNQGDQSFTAEELVRLGFAFRAQVLNALTAMQHYEAGLIDRASYDLVILSFKGHLTQPVNRVMWARQAAITPPSFSKVVEDWMGEIPLAAPYDIAAAFRDDLAKVMAQGGPSARTGPAVLGARASVVTET